MAESNDNPDALADALMELLGSDQGGEGSPSQEGESSAAPESEVAASDGEQPQGDTATSTPKPDDFDARYAARRQQERDEEQRSSRLAELEKLIEEGDDADIGRMFRAEYNGLKQQSQAYQQTTKAIADQIFEKSLDQDFIASLTDEQAVQLHRHVVNLDVPAFEKMVLEIKGSKFSATEIEAEVQRRVDAALQATTNDARGKQLRSPSPTSAPPANANAVATGTNDELWSNAFAELAGT